MLDYLTTYRNALVHEGRFSEDGLRDVNYLKLITEPLILALLEKGRRFPDRTSLEEYYVQSRQDTRTLATRRKAIDAVLRGR